MVKPMGMRDKGVRKDHLSKEERSKLMGKVRGKDTKPELIVRKLAHGMGFRFRLHRKGLPGSPDMVFPGRRKVVFIHGCFWHRHGCKFSGTPKSRVTFWTSKFERNVARDEATVAELGRLGWKVLVVWSCETKKTNMNILKHKLSDFLINE